MTKFFDRIIELIENGEVQISSHGYDELAADSIFIKDVFETVESAYIIKEYPDYSKGPCVLVL